VFTRLCSSTHPDRLIDVRTGRETQTTTNELAAAKAIIELVRGNLPAGDFPGDTDEAVNQDYGFVTGQGVSPDDGFRTQLGLSHVNDVGLATRAARISV
jgi:hypothetical protein